MTNLTIITINYNNSDGLSRTVESVARQSYAMMEYIIIDGLSSDNSVDVINSYNKFITHWVSEKDQGIYHAMNKGIKKSKGKYILFLNSGDFLVPGILNNFDNWQITEDIVYFNTHLYKDENNVKNLRYPDSLGLKYFISNTINHQSAFIKSSLFEKFGLYDEKYKIQGDFDFWIKSIVIGGSKTRYIPEYLTYYDTNGLSSLPDSQNIEEQQAVLNTYIPKSILKDYKLWEADKNNLEIMLWYRSQKRLYQLLVVMHKVINKIYKYIDIMTNTKTI